MGNGPSVKTLQREVDPSLQGKVQGILSGRKEVAVCQFVGFGAIPAANDNNNTKTKTKKVIIFVTKYRVYALGVSKWVSNVKLVWSHNLIDMTKISLTESGKGKKKATLAMLEFCSPAGLTWTQQILIADSHAMDFVHGILAAHAVATYGIPSAFAPKLKLDVPVAILEQPPLQVAETISPDLGGEDILSLLMQIFCNRVFGDGGAYDLASYYGLHVPRLVPKKTGIYTVEMDSSEFASYVAPKAADAMFAGLALAARFDLRFRAFRANGLQDGPGPMIQSIAELLKWNVAIGNVEFSNCSFAQMSWSTIGDALLKNPQPSFGYRFEVKHSNLVLDETWGKALQRAFAFVSPVVLTFAFGSSAGTENSAHIFFSVLGGEMLEALNANTAITLPYLGLLQEMDLRNMVISPKSLDVATMTLGGCTSLQKLSLAGALNSLTSGDQIARILQAFPVTPLAELDLSGNNQLFASGLGPNVDAVCDFICARLRTIAHVNLGKTGMNIDVLRRVLHAIEEGDPEAMQTRRKTFMETRRLVPVVNWSLANVLKALVLVDASDNQAIREQLLEQGESTSSDSLRISSALRLRQTGVNRDVQLNLLSLLEISGEEALLDLSNAYSVGTAPASVDYHHTQRAPEPPKEAEVRSWPESETLETPYEHPKEVKLAKRLGEFLGSCGPVWDLNLSSWNLGPASAHMFHGLGRNTTLLRLDISNNGIGDRGAEALGQGLRKNRTLVSLHMDQNNVGLHGWQAIRGALYGNKKLAVFTYPQKDAERRFEALRQQRQKGTEIWHEGKRLIKLYYRTPGKRTMCIEKIKFGKKLIRVADKEMEKISSTLNTIMACVKSNANSWEEKFAPKQEKYRSKISDRALMKVGRTQKRILKNFSRALQRNNKLRQQRSQNHMKTCNPYSKTYIDPITGGAFYVDNNYYHDNWGEEDDDAFRNPYVHKDPEQENPAAEILMLLGLGAFLFTFENLHQIEVNAAQLGPEFQSMIADDIQVARESIEQLEQFQSLAGVTGNAGPELVADTIDFGDVNLPSVDELSVVEDEVENDEMDEDNTIEDVEMYAGAGPDRRDPDVHTPPRAPAVRADALPTYSRFQNVLILDEPTNQTTDHHLIKRWKRVTREDEERCALQLRLLQEKEMLRSVLARGEFWEKPVSFSVKEVWTTMNDDARDWCVLCTQLSDDRIPRLERLARSWNGALSAAVFARDEEHGKHLVESLKSTCALLSEQHPRLGLHVVVVVPKRTVQWYPINMLRNVAMVKGSEGFPNASHAFLVDVDFVVDDRLGDRLREDDDFANHIRDSKDAAFVVPAFESKHCSLDNLGFTTEQVRERYANGNVEGFHMSAFPKGHGPTDFEFWVRGSAPDDSYAVKFEECFEPYVIVHLPDTPLYDERFTGYGMNKISHLFSLSQRGVSFRVLRDHCLMADPHPRSLEWESTSSNRDRKLFLKALFHSFKQLIRNGGQPMVSVSTIHLATKTKWQNKKNIKSNKMPSSAPDRVIFPISPPAALPPITATFEQPSSVVYTK